MTAPDPPECPRCDASASVTAIEGRLGWYVCSCCAKEFQRGRWISDEDYQRLMTDEPED